MASTDWPVNFPAIVRKPTKLAGDSYPQFLEGTLIIIKEDLQYELFRALAPRLNRWGIVSRNDIEIGSRSLDAPVLERFVIPDAAVRPTAVQGDTQVESAVLSVLKAIGDSSDIPEFRFLPSWVRTICTTKERALDVVSHIKAGMQKAGMWDVLNKKDFTMKDMLNAGVVLHKNSPANADSRRGIYLRFYEFSNANLNAVYVGRTNVSFGVRNVQHSAGVRSPPTGKKAVHHYKMANSSIRCSQVPLCELPDAEKYPQLHVVAEQLMILLFRSYDRVLFNNSPKIAEAEEDNVVSETGERFSHASRASPLRKVANATLAKITWPSMQSNDFGAVRGFNIQSPIGSFDSPKSFTWSRTESPDRTVFIRNGEAVNADSNEIVVHTFFNRNPNEVGRECLQIKFSAEQKRTEAPTTGTICHLSVEVMKDGKEHPDRWVSLPKLGPWSNWSATRSIGVRVLWKDENGVPRASYLHRNTNPLHLEPTNPGSFVQYADAVGLIAYLFQMEYQLQPRWWESYFGIADVYNITFNWLERTTVIEDRLPPKNNIMPRARALSFQEMTQAMRSAGLRNIAPLGQGAAMMRDPRASSAVLSRSRCDRCGRKGGCPGQKNKDGLQTCEFCEQFNAPCTYIQGKDIPWVRELLNFTQKESRNFMESETDYGLREVVKGLTPEET